MKLQSLKSWRFLLSLFLPVASVLLLASLLNWVSISSLRESYRKANAQEDAQAERQASSSS